MTLHAAPLMTVRRSIPTPRGVDRVERCYASRQAFEEWAEQRGVLQRLGDTAEGAGTGIGKMLAIFQPAVVFTKVWFMRNGVSGAGWPGAPMLKVIGT